MRYRMATFLIWTTMAVYAFCWIVSLATGDPAWVAYGFVGAFVAAFAAIVASPQGPGGREDGSPEPGGWPVGE